MQLCSEERFQNIPHQSLEELSLSLASSWLSLHQLQGLLAGQIQLSSKSFADQLEVICVHELTTDIRISMIQHIIIIDDIIRVTITTYIVYCSGHFSKKAAKIFLWCTTVIPFVTALGTKTTK